MASAERARLTTRMARAALSELPPAGGAIALAAGSSTEVLAKMIPGDGEWTVVTNSLPIALSLSVWPNVTLHLLGGRVLAGALATVDDAAGGFLDGVFVDVAFLGTSGISVEGGLTTAHREQAAVNRAFVQAAGRCVVLADHTTFGVVDLASFADLSQVDVVISDPALPQAVAARIRAAGPAVTLA